MSEGSKKKNYVRCLGKTLGITALAFILSYLFMAPFSVSTAAFFSTPEKNDFTITDFYNIVADSRAVSHLDDHVVVINIDNSDRQEIADILQIVSLCGPKAIGLDVMFDDRRDGDEVLHDAFRACPGLVMPLSMRPENDPMLFHINSSSYFYPDGEADTLKLGVEYAAASMPSKYEGSMVREMQTFFPTISGDTVISFPAALVRLADEEAYNRLRARGNRLEYVNFHSRRFAILEPESLMENADTISGRVVLIGAIHELGDLHPTPVNSAMPGVLIHAHSIATVMDGAYMERLPQWMNVMIGFLLCFIVVFTHVTFRSGALGLLLRLIQLGLLWVTVQVGYWFFIYHNLIIDFSYALVMLAFGLFACDIWNGVYTIIKNLIEKYRQKNEKSNTTI
ncbi:MAG: CHASE2 domain-containing protein [Muribaculaceae bacterium]|nr:CHASE2 domain-containing protein [Muribaculaceae bacterium]